jgi:hypothetical protein
LNASTKSVSFEEEIRRLEPDVRTILERFTRWDAILYAVVSNVGPNDSVCVSPRPLGAAASIAAGAQPGATSDDTFVALLVGAFYRVLLFREPDPTGLFSRIEQIRNGWPIEDVMRLILKSPEFAEKHTRFMQTYLGAAIATTKGTPTPRAERPSAELSVHPPEAKL